MARKTTKPTDRERSTIQARLKGKYPQMYDSTQADKDYLAGLPPELRRDILLKTTAKKLKKVYGG